MYNLETDIAEKNNLVKMEPKKTQETLSILNNWRVETKAPVPKQLNPDYTKPLNK
ncbi:MAG: hypothetical protein J7K34_02100 [Flavobacteriaceae bacterium]|nr:hypothetical protein [Flavobacteriaceae bacterium]